MPMSRLSFSSISSTDSRLGGGALEAPPADFPVPDDAYDDDDAPRTFPSFPALVLLVSVLPLDAASLSFDLRRVSSSNALVSSSKKSTNSSPRASSSSHSVRGRAGSGRFFSNASNSFSMSDQKSEKP